MGAKKDRGLGCKTQPSIDKEMFMSFSFYTVDTSYCNFLRQKDSRVPYTMDKKAIRPFLGIVFTVNGFNYYAPLTSPKPKHIHMKNQIDFLKINNGEWGAINFNNMIPVLPSSLNKVEIRIYDSDSKADKDYKNLLANQLSWCNSNKDTIIRQAVKLYNTIVQGRAWGNLSARCCNFTLDEKLCLEYAELLHIDNAVKSNENELDQKASVRDKLNELKSNKNSDTDRTADPQRKGIIKS